MSVPRIVEFDEIDSTNTESLRRAAAGERGPLWIRADRQNAGRGRSGRPWSSPSGNLSATYVFQPSAERRVFHQLSFVAGLAAHDAIAAALNSATSYPSQPQLKWPNDVMIDGAKVAGILVESTEFDHKSLVMIGIGTNIAVTPPVSERPVTRLQDYGATLSPSELLAHLANAMEARLEQWAGGAKFDAIRSDWLKRAHRIGARLSVHAGGELQTGTFQGLADNGALRLRTETGETILIEHGDVSLFDEKPMLETDA